MADDDPVLSLDAPPGQPEGDGQAVDPPNLDEPVELGEGRARSGSARLISAAVGVVLIALVALLAFGGSDDENGVTALLAQRTPEVSGETLGGGTFDIDDHRGSWVLVNFFATWCPGCVEEHPELVELEAWGAENDLQLVSVVFNDPVDRVEVFFAERGGSWPVLNNPSVPVEFQVAQIPETFLVAPSGQIVLHVEGEVVADEVVRFIEGAR